MRAPPQGTSSPRRESELTLANLSTRVSLMPGGTDDEQELIEANLATMSRVADHDGVPYGRLRRLVLASELYSDAVGRELPGYQALADSFSCHVLETIETTRRLGLTATPSVSEAYTWFVPRILVHFESLCAAETTARSGYPYPAFTILRNTFDGVLLTSAAVQRVEHWLRIDGLDPKASGSLDVEVARKMKIAVERKIFEQMTGAESGLPLDTVESLARLNKNFDAEVHDARLSKTRYVKWSAGREGLMVGPHFDINDHQFPNYMNRFLEIAWMVHRLLPLLQTSASQLPPEWKTKWRDLDGVFRDFVVSVVGRSGRRIGAAVAQFVELRFPFHEEECFPDLPDGSGMESRP